MTVPYCDGKTYPLQHIAEHEALGVDRGVGECEEVTEGERDTLQQPGLLLGRGDGIAYHVANQG